MSLVYDYSTRPPVTPKVSDHPREVHTVLQWWSIINEDSKIVSMESRLGKPNSIESGDTGKFSAGRINSNSCFKYTWYRHVDIGTTTTEALEVIALFYPDYGVGMIVALRDPVSRDWQFFAWTPHY